MNRNRIVRLLLAIAVLATAGYLLRGYITDDTYIHLRYADNLIQRGEFSFNPGQNTYGATSPLWIFGLALFLKLGFAPFTAAWILGVGSGLLMVFVFDAIVERLTFTPRWKLAIVLLAVGDVWFLRWTFSGMETPLATAMLLILLYPLVSGRDLGWGVTREPMWVRYLGWGVAAGLAGLVRPEFMIIVPLALPWLLWFEYFRASANHGAEGRHRARPHKPVLAAAGGWLAIIGPWLLYAWSAFGRITPGTASAKSSDVSFNLLEILTYFYRTVRQLAVTQGFLWVVILVLIALVIVRNRALSGNQDWHEYPELNKPLESQNGNPGQGGWSVWGPVALLGIAATWFFVLLGGYALKRVWIISRYVSPLAPVLLLAMSVLAEWLTGGRGLGDKGRLTSRLTVLAGIVLTLALNGWILVTQVVPHAQKFPVGVQECYLGMGQWLNENTPEDAVIAAVDIGAVGYASERQVLDLMGLVSPEILELGRTIGFQAMVERGDWLNVGTGANAHRPDYLVDRSEGLPRWTDKVVHGVRFELIDTCVLEGVGLREPQPWTVALYRLVSADKRVSDSTGG